MSLNRDLCVAVDDVAAGQLPASIVVEDHAHRLELALKENGPVGLAFDSLDFEARGAAAPTPRALRAWADGLAGRLTYLMEPLAVIEHDADAAEILLRSRVPSGRAGVRSYYEASLKGDGRVRLGRVAFDEDGRRRRPVPCHLTREALDRLVDDLVEVIR